jgi:hypothetical protein
VNQACICFQPRQKPTMPSFEVSPPCDFAQDGCIEVRHQFRIGLGASCFLGRSGGAFIGKERKSLARDSGE